MYCCLPISSHLDWGLNIFVVQAGEQQQLRQRTRVPVVHTTTVLLYIPLQTTAWQRHGHVAPPRARLEGCMLCPRGYNQERTMRFHVIVSHHETFSNQERRGTREQNYACMSIVTVRSTPRRNARECGNNYQHSSVHIQ